MAIPALKKASPSLRTTSKSTTENTAFFPITRNTTQKRAISYSLGMFVSTLQIRYSPVSAAYLIWKQNKCAPSKSRAPNTPIIFGHSISARFPQRNFTFVMPRSPRTIHLSRIFTFVHARSGSTQTAESSSQTRPSMLGRPQFSGSPISLPISTRMDFSFFRAMIPGGAPIC